jgi:hypothetical protein
MVVGRARVKVQEDFVVVVAVAEATTLGERRMVVLCWIMIATEEAADRIDSGGTIDQRI